MKRYQLTDVLNTTQTIENDFRNCLKQLKYKLLGQPSRRVLHEVLSKAFASSSFPALTEEQTERVDTLPGYQKEEFLYRGIEADIRPKELVEKILQYEHEQASYYRLLKNELVYEQSKSICDILISYKIHQIQTTQSILENIETIPNG